MIREGEGVLKSAGEDAITPFKSVKLNQIQELLGKFPENFEIQAADEREEGFEDAKSLELYKKRKVEFNNELNTGLVHRRAQSH